MYGGVGLSWQQKIGLRAKRESGQIHPKDMIHTLLYAMQRCKGSMSLLFKFYDFVTFLADKLFNSYI